MPDLRIVPDIVRFSGKHDRTLVHDQDAVSDAQSEREVLLDHEERMSLCVQFFDERPNFTDNQRAQSFGRLVHQENIGILYQRSRDSEHLLLAAGQRSAARGSPRMQARKRLINRIEFPTSGACPRQRQFDIFNHGQRRKYPMTLRHPADAAANNLVGRKSRDDVSAQPYYLYA